MLRLERRWLGRILGAVLPTGEVELEGFAVELLARMPRQARVGVRAAVWLIQLAPWWLRLSGRPFSRLEPAGQAAVLERLRKSRSYAVRQLLSLVKLIACLGYGGQPVLRQGLALEGPVPPAGEGGP